MPAVELNSLPPADTYDIAKQKVMFKLWLVLTTDQFVVGDGVRLFPTTKKAEEFKRDCPKNGGKVYYIDLQKLAAQLKPLHARDVKRIVKTMMQNNREFLQTATNLFRTYAQDPCEYGPAGCDSVQAPLDICLPVPKQAEAKFKAAQKNRSGKAAALKTV